MRFAGLIIAGLAALAGAGCVSVQEVRTGAPVRVVDVTWIRTDRSCGYYPDEDPVLVRHPRPEVGQ